jgi:hypothetical protein
MRNSGNEAKESLKTKEERSKNEPKTNLKKAKTKLKWTLKGAKTAPFAQNEAKLRSQERRVLTSPKGAT